MFSVSILYILKAALDISLYVVSITLGFNGQFGRGDHGRLGYGRKVTTGHPMEVPINLPPPKNRGSSGSSRWRAKFVACGGRHTLAIASWVDEESEQNGRIMDN